MTEENVISGTMDIEFETRSKLDTSGDLKKGSPALGAKDTYKFALQVGKTTEFAGTITRMPKLFSSVLGRTKQDASLYYSVDLAVFNPADLKQKKVVGKWVGTVPMDPETGAFDLSGGKAKESALRVKVDTMGKASAFEDAFAGKLVGKAEKKEGLASSIYERVVGGRTVKVTVKKSDPMRFENIALAMGPAPSYPKTVVVGRLDYDYETGNYFSDGITFRYALDGKDYEDIVTGSIKWVKEKDYETSGKSYYEFNLRFNEAKNKTATNESAAFEKMSEEDAFFAVDNSIPALTGRISYVDVKSGEDSPPTSSKVTYALNANKLTKQQIMNFFKLWLLAVGPTNDE
ncbi:MAG: hypothetical protein JNK78_11135 [Planctomycetes bacterium]|nr:hypothetical protein [Planctomycetota bacterium]